MLNLKGFVGLNGDKLIVVVWVDNGWKFRLEVLVEFISGFEFCCFFEVCVNGIILFFLWNRWKEFLNFGLFLKIGFWFVFFCNYFI